MNFNRMKLNKMNLTKMKLLKLLPCHRTEKKNSSEKLPNDVYVLTVVM